MLLVKTFKELNFFQVFILNENYIVKHISIQPLSQRRSQPQQSAGQNMQTSHGKKTGIKPSPWRLSGPMFDQLLHLILIWHSDSCDSVLFTSITVASLSSGIYSPMTNCCSLDLSLCFWTISVRPREGCWRKSQHMCSFWVTHLQCFFWCSVCSPTASL